MNVQAKDVVFRRDEIHSPLRLSAFSQTAQKRAFRLALMLSDSVLLIVSLIIAYWLRFDLHIGLAPEIVPEAGFYGITMVVLLPIWLALFALFRLYDFRYLLGGTDEYARVFNASSVAILMVIVATFLRPEMQISRGWLIYAWILALFLVWGARFWLRRLVYWLRGRGYFVVPAVVVGVNEEAIALGEQLAAWSSSGLLVLGLVNNGNDEPEKATLTAPSHLQVIGEFDQLPGLVQRYGIQEVIVATSAVSSDHLMELFRRFGANDCINLRLSSGIFDAFTTGLYVKELGYVPLISVNKMRLSTTEAFIKRCLDVAGAAFGLVVLSPLLLATALLVKRDSPGPAIYRRRVLGQGGKVFDAFKFRSMYIDGDSRLSTEEWAELQTHHKLREDPRITCAGRVLRKYSLDELPQLVNVLKGEMSLIGPRMITPAEQEKYGKWDMNLLTVKPGLSGLWQVSGRSDVSYEQRVQLDMQYIRNYSVWLDIALIFRTILSVVKGTGAY